VQQFKGCLTSYVGEKLPNISQNRLPMYLFAQSYEEKRLKHFNDFGEIKT